MRLEHRSREKSGYEPNPEKVIRGYLEYLLPSVFLISQDNEGLRRGTYPLLMFVSTAGQDA